MRKFFFLFPGLLSASTVGFATDVASGFFDTSVPAFRHKMVADLEVLQQKMTAEHTQSTDFGTKGWSLLSGSWPARSSEKENTVTVILCTRKPVAASDELLDSYGLTWAGTSSQSAPVKPRDVYKRKLVNNRYVHVVETITETTRYFYYRADIPEENGGFNLPPIPGLDASCTGFRYGDHFAFLKDLGQPEEQCTSGAPVTINVAHLFDGENGNYSTKGDAADAVPGILTYSGGKVLCCFCGSQTSDSSSSGGMTSSGGIGAQGGMGSSSGDDGGDEKRPFSTYERSIPEDGDPITENKRKWVTTLRYLIGMEDSQKRIAKERMIGQLNSRYPDPSQQELNDWSTLQSWAIGQMPPVSDESDENQPSLGGDGSNVWNTIFNLVLEDASEQGAALLINVLAGLDQGIQMSIQSNVQKARQGTAKGRTKQNPQTGTDV